MLTEDVASGAVEGIDPTPLDNLDCTELLLMLLGHANSERPLHAVGIDSTFSGQERTAALSLVFQPPTPSPVAVPQAKLPVSLVDVQSLRNASSAAPTDSIVHDQSISLPSGDLGTNMPASSQQRPSSSSPEDDVSNFI